MNNSATLSLIGIGTIIGLGLVFAAPSVQSNPWPPPPGGCPDSGWATNVLPTFNTPSSTVPTDAPGSFCEFHQTTYESFVWATTMINGAPRFMSLKTPDQLNTTLGMVTPHTSPAARKTGGVALTLASRGHGPEGNIEGAGAIVEADGNMLVGPNGYPIYASVHMNDSYFNTAQQNLIVTGGYVNNTSQGANFNVGAAVFKATWMRLGTGETPPAGSFVTKANVPVLANTNGLVAPNGSTVQVDVALLGLHVVELTNDHPEFLWGTFEHKLNSPRLPDGTYNANNSSSKNFTLYKAGTTFGNTNVVNLSNGATPVTQTTFNATTQTFSPTQNVAQLNATGGDPSGTVPLVNTAGKSYLQSQNSVFANYDLIGTVWFAPNAYVTPITSGCAIVPPATTAPAACSFGATNGVGSVNLANSTAETFDQAPQSTFGNNPPVNNCFSCHNATSYTFQTPALPARLIASSHVLAQGCLTYGTPNQVLLSGTAPAVGACAPPAAPKPAPAAAPNVAPHMRK